MAEFRVGVQLHPQHTTYSSYAQAVRTCEQIGVDTVWNWDHFFPLYGDPQGNHFEGWTLLTAMATLTQRVEVGCLVTCNSYRNPALLANMAKTVDHISGGRLILGIGAGWFERDYATYGYPFGTARTRIEALAKALPVIKERWQVEVPAPLRNPIPILIGGSGEKRTLRIVAEHADIWNCIESPEDFRRKNAILDEWCRQVGRDPAEIERSVGLFEDRLDSLDAFRDAGATHLILAMGEPWNFKAVEQLVAWRERQ